MKGKAMFVAALFVAALGGCNDHDADDRVSDTAATGTGGCKIVYAKGVGVTIPHVIAATDATPKNDALKYYNSLGEESREALSREVYQQALKTFDCVPAQAGKTCVKRVHIGYGIGHLAKLKKDLMILQAERSCRVK